MEEGFYLLKRNDKPVVKGDKVPHHGLRKRLVGVVIKWGDEYQLRAVSETGYQYRRQLALFEKHYDFTPI